MTNSFPPTYRLIVKNLLPKGSLKILDLGCGVGAAAEVLNRNKTHQFTGVDIHNPYLKICRNRGFYKEVIRCDLRKIKFAKNSFDVVLLLQVIEHLNKKDASELIKKAMKIAAKAVVISVPNGKCSQEIYDGNIFNQHKSTWSVSDFKKLGFKVYGQGLRIIYGSKSYEGRIEASWWQKILVPLSTVLFPLILLVPEISVQLIGVKYKDEASEYEHI